MAAKAPITPTAKWVSTPAGPAVEIVDAKGTRTLSSDAVYAQRDGEIMALWSGTFVPGRDAITAAYAFATNLIEAGLPGSQLPAGDPDAPPLADGAAQ